MKRRSPRLLPLALVLTSVPLFAGIPPLASLDPKGLQEYNAYIARFEADSARVFVRDAVLWIDGQSTQRKSDFAQGTSFSETRAVVGVPSAQIHHLFGTIRLPGLTIAAATAIMQSYSRYPEFFYPDIAKGRAVELPDSRIGAKHFQVFAEMLQSTAWLDIAFDSSYDAHYDLLANGRAMITSKSLYLREFRNAHHLEEGTLPEGSDHGFLWRTYNSWHIRERAGGLDMELNSISLSRPIPFGFGWWANRTARGAIDKMINRTADAIRKNTQGPSVQR